MPLFGKKKRKEVRQLACVIPTLGTPPWNCYPCSGDVELCTVCHRPCCEGHSRNTGSGTVCDACFYRVALAPSSDDWM